MEVKWSILLLLLAMQKNLNSCFLWLCIDSCWHNYTCNRVALFVCISSQNNLLISSRFHCLFSSPSLSRPFLISSLRFSYSTFCSCSLTFLVPLASSSLSLPLSFSLSLLFSSCSCLLSVGPFALLA